MSTTSSLVDQAISEFDQEEIYLSDPVDVTVFNQYNLRPNLGVNDGQVNDEEDLCDPKGYEPLEQQILDSYRAGAALQAYMEETYPNGVPTDADLKQEEDGQPIDYGMDELDAYDLAKTVMNRLLTEQLKAQAAAAQTDAGAAKPPPPPPPPPDDKVT